MGPSYKAEPLQCAACLEKESASEKFRDAGGDMRGTYFAVGEERRDL